MTNTQRSPIDFERILDKNELLFVRKKSEALKFVGTDHTAADTADALKGLLKFETQQNEVLGAIVKMKARTEFREEATRLCERCKEQNEFLLQMRNLLTDDLREKQREEDRQREDDLHKAAEAKAKRIDVLKEASFYIGVPVGFVAMTKNGFGDGRWTVDDAGGVGFVVSNTVLLRKPIIKKIKTGFASVSKGVCELSTSIRYDMRIYYAKDLVRQGGAAIASLAHKAIAGPRL